MTPAGWIVGLACCALVVYLFVKADDYSDGNVERLEKDERATEARWWLVRLERGYV